MAMTSTLALFISLNLLISTALVSACGSCGGGSRGGGSPGGGLPNQPAPTRPNRSPTCPRDALKLDVCADLLGGLVHLVVGSGARSRCCTLLSGLADLDVAVCLCIAIRANILGINLNIPVALSLLVNQCGRTLPNGFQCA
ncbi:hypothetical protein AMTRI_Chr12g271410 [Amborella trichopoda]|uniref:Bifunctional inhibitor/plant lipid transfer protein/seed storage helical domain-containing protein n=1 Tax=Amborella trichopoda TaxID=13333 RepID=W1P4J4_AMBTC|nr:14 kDa proline-rich protein DC2.15 [Amborella trichopoda]ERN02838.1 hypothetical protein AMTR_s00086p00157840 [Amborella trichopoda]|eukprot:XP_006841163.1 14 kDa proline-rich protein DC2.15 [Amborella trichopoda]